MANSIAQMAIKAYSLVNIMIYIFGGLAVLLFALLLFKKIYIKSIIKYTVTPVRVFIIIGMTLTGLSAGFYLGASLAFGAAYSKTIVYTVQKVNKDNIVVKSDKGKVKKVDYDIAKKISKKQGFKKGQKVDLGSKELVKSTPKDVRKLLDKYPV